MVTYKECLEIGKECGLTNKKECVDNILRHYDMFFHIENLYEEEQAFFRDIQQSDPEFFDEHFVVKNNETN